jgi:hypothetical protein
MRPLELVKKIVTLGTGLRKRSEGTSTVALDAALRAIDTTTMMARQVRAGPLPPATGVERIALTVAAGQLRLVATSLGLANARPADPPPPDGTSQAPPPRDRGDALSEPPVDPGFVSPGDRALVRDEKEARMRAALGNLLVETLALVDEVLATPAELRGGTKGGALPPRG